MEFKCVVVLMNRLPFDVADHIVKMKTEMEHAIKMKTVFRKITMQTVPRLNSRNRAVIVIPILHRLIQVIKDCTDPIVLKKHQRKFFDLIMDNRDFLENMYLRTAVHSRLMCLFYDEGWCNATIYHNILFGEYI